MTGRGKINERGPQREDATRIVPHIVAVCSTMVLQPYTDKQREPVEKSKRLRIRMGTICRLNNLRLSENRFLKRGNVGFDI